MVLTVVMCGRGRRMVLLTLLKKDVLVFGIASFGVTLFVGVTLATAEGTPGIEIGREFVAA